MICWGVFCLILQKLLHTNVLFLLMVQYVRRKRLHNLKTGKCVSYSYVTFLVHFSNCSDKHESSLLNIDVPATVKLLVQHLWRENKGQL